MTRKFVAMMLGMLLLTTTSAMAYGPAETMVDSEQVLNELMAIPARQIPKKLLDEAQGIVIVPNVIKIGFIAGARRGHGVVLVRDQEGEWSLPQFVTLTGGSVGWQAGIQGTDVVLVFTSRQSVDGLFRGKFTIGVDAAVTAGPVGREAAAGTDTELRSEIYSYSRSRGLFVGVALDGSALDVDYEAHNYIYGSPIGELPRQIPPAASHLRGLITELSPSHSSKPISIDQPMAAPQPRRVEAIRRSLVQSSTQLQSILSPEWRPYLALPKDVYEPATTPLHEGLATSLKRFQIVNDSPDYRQLTQRSEFQSTFELLQEYEQAVTANRSRLELPPPPQHNP